MSPLGEVGRGPGSASGPDGSRTEAAPPPRRSSPTRLRARMREGPPSGSRIPRPSRASASPPPLLPLVRRPGARCRRGTRPVRGWAQRPFTIAVEPPAKLGMPPPGDHDEADWLQWLRHGPPGQARRVTRTSLESPGQARAPLHHGHCRRICTGPGRAGPGRIQPCASSNRFCAGSRCLSYK